MTKQRQRPGAGLWIAITLAVLIPLYPLSFGPAMWLVSKELLPDFLGLPMALVYWPLVWLMNHVPFIEQAMTWYVGLWIPDIVPY